MPEVALDAAAVREWMRASQTALGNRRAEIDALNVYPVPDGDTGTNMYLTVEAAAISAMEITDPRPEPGPVAEALARGALLGARGNSGVILSQMLRGLADVLATTPAPDGAALSAGLTRAADLAYSAVSRPVEGTVLTVARAAAEAGAQVAQSGLAHVAKAASGKAHEALALTPTQLPELAAAGVVDAGGMGYCVVLDALAGVLTGEELAIDPTETLVVHEPQPGQELHSAS